MTTNYFSRRWFLALGAQLCSAAARVASRTAPLSGIRHFRANATILLMGMPIYRRSEVGGAVFRIHQASANGVNELALQFAAGSLPERAAGLNRLGYIEERIAAASNADPVKPTIRYYGFMSASKEENLDEAKKALAQGAAGPHQFTVMKGDITAGQVHNTLAHVAVAEKVSWANCLEVAERSRSIAMEQAKLAQIPESAAPLSFLYAVWLAMVDEDARRRESFVHNGKLYELRSTKKADPRLGAEFAKAKMAQNGANVQFLEGHIVNNSGVSTQFHLWFEEVDGAPWPIRFDFRPRSFLRLSFETKPA